jgi:hypothetical protein
MGRVKDWLIEMEQDAVDMSRDEWMTKHGETVVEVYDDMQRKIQGDLFDVPPDNAPD